MLRGVKNTIMLIPFKRNFKEYIDKEIANFVKRKLEKNDLTFLNNLVLKARSNAKTYLELIRWMDKELKKMKVSLGEDNYILLKTNSNNFKRVLDNLGISNFNYDNYIKVINGDYDIYLNGRIKGKDLGFTIMKYNYFKSLLNNYQSKRIKYLLANYQIIDKLYELFIENIGLVRKIVFDKVIVNLKEKDLNTLFLEYNKYLTSKNTSFLNKLSSLIDKEEITEINLELKQRYAYFFQDTINLEDKRNFIDKEFQLLEKIDIKRIDAINRYLNGEILRTSKEAKIARRDLERIKLNFNNYLNNRSDNSIKAAKRLDFINDNEIDLLTQKEIVEIIMQKFSKDKQKIINDYLEGREDKNNLKIALKGIEEIKRQYFMWKDTGLFGDDYLILLLNSIGYTDKDIRTNLKGVNPQKIKTLSLRLKKIELLYREYLGKKKDYLRFLKTSLVDIEEASLELKLEEYIIRTEAFMEEFRRCKNM